MDIIRSQTLRDLALKSTIVDNSPRDRTVSMIRNLDEVHEKEIAPILARVEERVRPSVQISIPTPGMQWLIAAWKRSKGARFQHVFCYRLQPQTDVPRLEKAWQTLLARHAILRSTFASSDTGNPYIVTFDYGYLGSRWTEKSFNLLHIKDLQAKVQDFMEALISDPPDMQEPMTHAYVLRSTKMAFLILHLHHFQYDAWSIELLLHDLHRLYNGAEPLSPDKGWADLSILSSQQENIVSQKRYWTQAFPADFKPEFFPRSDALQQLPKGGVPRTYGVCIKSDAIPRASQLEAYAKAKSLSVQAILLACWAKAQASYTSTNCSTFGLWHSGRGLDIPDIDKLAVPCINILPIHVPNIELETSIDQIARWISEDLKLRAGAVEQSELKRVHEWIGYADAPICNAFVNYIKIAAEKNDECEKILTPVEVNTQFDCSITLTYEGYDRFPIVFQKSALHSTSQR